jgi:hypothetical protein
MVRIGSSRDPGSRFYSTIFSQFKAMFWSTLLSTFDFFADQQLGAFQTTAERIAQASTAIDNEYLAAICELGTQNADFVFTVTGTFGVFQRYGQVGNARC